MKDFGDIKRNNATQDDHRRSLTVVIACFNEEDNLEPTYRAVRTALDTTGDWDCEIIIVDDGSSDNTAAIANTLAQKDPDVRVVCNGENRGFGHSFHVGLHLGTKQFLTVIPGDNEIVPESITGIFSALHKADLIVSYPTNLDARPKIRIGLSRGFVLLINILFGFKFNYYNGPNIYPRIAVGKLNVNVNSFAFNAIAVVKLMRSGCTCFEVPMQTRPRLAWKSSAVKVSNILSVLRDTYGLCLEVYFPALK